MTAPTTTPEITLYRDSVRSALADLSDEDRDDLMEDVESHLTEVFAEDDGSLARLGSPEDYAAELRTSAGLPAQNIMVQASLRTRLSAALADSAAGRRVERIMSTPVAKSLRSFLTELRPGWWVLRGYLVAVVATGVFGAADGGLIPMPAGSAVLGLLLTLLAIWASVRVGRYAQTHGTLRPWIVIGTGLLLLFFVFVGVNRTPSYDYAPVDQQPGPVGLSNIYVFDSQGRPLTGVQLFDQDGNPLQVDDQMFDANGNPVTVRRSVDANGQTLFNVFPREVDPGPAGTGVGPRPNIFAPRLAPTAGASPEASGPPAPGASAALPSASPSPR